jgi:SAM-dependent methyltransferase
MIPLNYEAVVAEIVRFAGLPEADVRERVWQEALVPGINIRNEVPQFGVTPHRYDAAMERLYTDGVGFIYSGMVYWTHPQRQRWTQHALQRLRHHGELRHQRVLMLGDGTGNDSLYLAHHGVSVDYFDVPGSRTYQFAVARFRHYGVADSAVRLLTDYRQIPIETYDALLCFEVLEHLPDPPAAIADQARFLKSGGIALVTEAFGEVTPALPTHLATNLRYAGKTAPLYAAAGLGLTWYATDPLFKPCEFQKGARVKPWWQDRRLRSHFLHERWRAWRRRR